jgi:Flp pilus assembly protein TadD
LLCASVLLGAGPEFDEAKKLYSLTEFEKSLKVLESVPAKDAAVYELIGLNHYMLGDYRQATDAMEKAVAADPSNSQYHLWLGRAYGRRAETSAFLTAPGYASRARQYFEKSVQLNSRNLEALNDLFEYYLEAPGFLGGGFDKAAALSAQIAALDQAEGHWAQYKLAEKRKQYDSAEQQLRHAIDLAPQQVGRVIDLARFLAKQGRFQEADQSFAHAEVVAPNSPKVMFAEADYYIKNNRNLPAARTLLERYLSSTLTPDDPPRAEARKLLRQVKGS